MNYEMHKHKAQCHQHMHSQPVLPLVLIEIGDAGLVHTMQDIVNVSTLQTCIHNHQAA